MKLLYVVALTEDLLPMDLLRHAIAQRGKKSFYGRVGSRIYVYLTDGLVTPRDLAIASAALNAPEKQSPLSK